MNCILCEKDGRKKIDTQKHIIKCPAIQKVVKNQINIKYKHLTSNILTEQINLAKQLRINYKIRETLMNEAEQKHVRK